MAQPSDSRILYSVEPTAIASPTPAETPEVPGPSDISAHAPTNQPSPTYLEPPLYVREALDDAERLLKYAAETGVDVDTATRDHILDARAAGSSGWTEEIVANLLAALTALSARLRPICAESLKAYADDSESAVRTYWIVAVLLAIVIIPFSIASFVSSAISTAIRTDIATANDLAVKLRAQLGPPPAATASSTTGAAAPPAPLPAGLSESDVISELQDYAATTRAIDGRARQLNLFVFNLELDPYASIRNNPKEIHKKFQLPQGLPDFAAAADGQTQLYQDVRYFAQSILDDISVFYGATATCLLPVLYALLGTCAYLLRSFEQQMSLRTFMPTVANSARFLIAAIGGAVVGLFNNFTITQGASIPPLAIAFLVGYAVDVFFTFLESLIGAFTKNKSAPPPPQPVPASPKP
jgi:hypothetical protein